MRKENVGTTHVIGIGDGVSYEMIKKGAIEGGGEYLFIKNNK